MPWAFLVLPLSMYSIWVIWPIIQSFALSFTDWRGIEPKVNFIGFENFTRLFGDKVFWTSLKNNLLWLILFVGIPVPIGLLVAMLFDIKLPGGKGRGCPAHRRRGDGKGDGNRQQGKDQPEQEGSS